ncbi:hypothetical protein PMI27_005343 [Pseudomonas sp. GM41(2012)]|nr:hypothetical protein PMI27_005343 [Pseudomonas sp. GM41(2012)]
MVTSQGDDNMTINTQELAAPVIVEPKERDRVDNQFRFRGTGVPGAIVHVVSVFDNSPVLRVPVASDGTWASGPSDPLPNGPNKVRSFQMLNQERSHDSPELTFTVQ